MKYKLWGKIKQKKLVAFNKMTYLLTPKKNVNLQIRMKLLKTYLSGLKLVGLD